MFNKKIFLVILVTLLFCLFFSCKSRETIDIFIKGVRFSIECARTNEQRRTGLMYRKKLGPREGMIFIFPQNAQTPFWMKNTYIPLSVAFLSEEGEILDIKDMTPLSTDLVKSRYPYKYALEVNQGILEEIGVHTGDYIVLPRGLE
ncbi:MAG: DUF192 domain-containing protein [Spirochaetales bacterium]|nr:DUF192 domain-containing protein [Spirochaetales bacterium]